MKLGKFRFAVKTLTQAAKRLPKSDSTKKLLGQAVELKEVMEQVRNLEKDREYAMIIKITKNCRTDNRFLLMARAKAFLYLSEHEKAIEDASKVIGANERDFNALLLRSRAYFQNGNLGKALQDCQEAVKVRDDNGGSSRLYHLLQLIENSLQEISNSMEAQMCQQAVDQYVILNDRIKLSILDVPMKEGVISPVDSGQPRDLDSCMMNVTVLEDLMKPSQKKKIKDRILRKRIGNQPLVLGLLNILTTF